MATEIRNRVIVFVLVVIGAILFLLPNLTFLPNVSKDTFASGWISKPLSLGLDLRGGVYLLYEVQVNEAVKSRQQVAANSIRSDLRAEKVPVTRTLVNDKSQIEVTLLSDRYTEQAKTKIDSSYRDISYVQTVSDGERVKLVYGLTEPQIERISSEAVNQAVETLRNRVDAFGVSEPMIQRVGGQRILLQMPGEQDIERVKKRVGSTAKLEFRLLPLAEDRSNSVQLKDRKNVPVYVEDQALMTGDAVEYAHSAIEQGQVEVALKLTTEGARTFKRITTEYTKRNLAIILDGIVYSSPEIREPITGGSASISGGFDLEEARDLAVVLRAGSLPASLKILEERTVGPTLGAESIKKGVLAMFVGFAFIIVFMGIYYKRAGLVAIASLCLNLVFMLACLSAFGATLTLPGLAGLALTLGMAVDSNVIIFERIRDEVRIGATRDASVKAGFNKAWTAILDSNMTTLISGMLLYSFGTGPVRGFAVTLSVGILTTMFCAIFVCKLAFDGFKLENSQGKLSI